MKKIYSTKKALIASILAMCMCFTMLVGTTFAWFTDAVTSDGNIIKTGTLDVTMEWTDGSNDPEAAATVWKDASKGAMFDYANWEPGYAVARHIKVSNVGTLALNYQMRIVANGIVSKLADVIDVYYFDEDEAAVRDDLNSANYLGTLTEVLGTEKHLSKKVYGSLKAGDPADVHTIILKMQESAGNEYQNMDLGCTFSVELIATQMASETDSFDNKYDEQAPVADIPAALVRPLENLNIETVDGAMTLNAGYQFQPTMGRPENPSYGEPGASHLPYDPENSVENSAYRYWHADFVVKADRDVPANSIVLAGYYSFFCDNFGNDGKWVTMESDSPITAGTEIRLVSALSDMMGGEITVSYNDLCAYGNDGKGFMCGVAAEDIDALAGTTITVELRMYETPAQGECATGGGCTHPFEECETGAKPLTIGTFTYTFSKNVATADELATAITNGVENITLTKDVTLDNAALNVAAGSDIVLDLGGKTITVNNNEATASAAINNKGNLTIKNGTVTYEGVGDPNFGYGTNTIHNTGKLVIDGATVINTTASGSSVAIDCAAGAELIVNGGEIISEKNAIRLCPFGGAPINCTINGGTITGSRAIQIQLPSNNPADAPVINLTVNGGELTGTSGLALYSYSAGQSFANTNVTITGGTFNGDVCFGGGAKATQENVAVTGGTFSGYLGRYLANDGWADIVKP